MKSKGLKYRLKILFAVLLIISIPLGVYGIKKGTEPDSVSGGYYSLKENRIDFTLDKTEFTFTQSETGTYLITAELSIKKCEEDFYAIINSVDFDGLDFDYISFGNRSTATEAYITENLILRDSAALCLELEIPVNISEKGTYTAEILIDYTSGITFDTADTHILSIPLTVTVK